MKLLKKIITTSSLIVLAACGSEMDNNADNTTNPNSSSQVSPTPEPNPEITPETKPERPTLGQQIDRMGRPAINTALNNTFNGDKSAKDAAKVAYGQATPSEWSAYVDDFAASLAILDSLDTVCGNQLLADAGPARYMTLANVLVDDQLYVNSNSGECGTYLGLEAEVVGAIPAGAGGCGGRTPADDVIERSYSVLAAGILAGIDDGVTEDDGIQTAVFPFLGEPTLTE
jgi:hypothetical protein